MHFCGRKQLSAKVNAYQSFNVISLHFMHSYTSDVFMSVLLFLPWPWENIFLHLLFFYVVRVTYLRNCLTFCWECISHFTSLILEPVVSTGMNLSELCLSSEFATTPIVLQTAVWSQPEVCALFGTSKCWEELCFKGLRRVFFKSVFIWGKTADLSLCSLSALLKYVSSQLCLGSFQYNKVFSCWPLRAWGIWRTLLLGIRLDSRCNCITCLPPPCFSLQTKSDKPPIGYYFLRLPGDLWLRVKNVRWRQQNNREQRKIGCYSTSLHITGLQMMLVLWWGDDLFSVTNAESGSLRCFSSELLLFERHMGEIKVRSHDGYGVQIVRFQSEKTWENRRKWCREKSDVRWFISKVPHISLPSESGFLSSLCLPLSLSCGVVILSSYC